MVYQYGCYEIKIDVENIEVKELYVCEEMNQHGEAVVKGVLKEPEGADSILLGRETIAITNREGSYLFTGIICSMEIDREGGFSSFTLSAKSSTWELDRIKRNRVFQDQDMAYSDIVKAVLASYGDASFIDTVTEGKRLPHMILQFRETDWDFLKRLSSHFKEGIYGNNQSESIQLFFGMRKRGGERLEGELVKRSIDVLEKQEVLTIRACKNYRPGLTVSYMQAEYFVEKTELFMERGEMQFQLRLVRDREKEFPYQANTLLAGARLPAFAKAVKRNRVRLRFQMEGKQEGKAPYIPYAGEVNNEAGFYMPDPGDEVDVYFPDSEEEHAMVVSAGRAGGERRRDFSYSMKYMGNKQQVKWYMDERLIGFSGGGGGAEIKMSGDGTLLINSPETLSMKTGGSLELGGGDRKVSMYAEKGCYLNAGTVESSGIELKENGNIVCKTSQCVRYKRNEGPEAMKRQTEKNSGMAAHEVRYAGMALSGVEFLSQAITGTRDFKNSRKIMNRLLGQESLASEGESGTGQSEYNPIKEELFQNNERLFHSFSYGENKNG